MRTGISRGWGTSVRVAVAVGVTVGARVWVGNAVSLGATVAVMTGKAVDVAAGGSVAVGNAAADSVAVAAVLREGLSSVVGVAAAGRAVAVAVSIAAWAIVGLCMGEGSSSAGSISTEFAATVPSLCVWATTCTLAPGTGGSELWIAEICTGMPWTIRVLPSTRSTTPVKLTWVSRPFSRTCFTSATRRES